VTGKPRECALGARVLDRRVLRIWRSRIWTRAGTWIACEPT
jgi:hypothetical protein